MDGKIKIVCPFCDSVNSVPSDRALTKANCGKCKKSLLYTKPIELSRSRFNLHVANNDVPLVVDFWASWCGPCKMMAPVFEQVSSKFALKARFAKVNTEAEQSLSSKFDIRSIPTLIIFKGGREIDRVSGALNAAQLEKWVRSRV